MGKKLIFVNVLLLIIGHPIIAQPDFSADATWGCDTLTVQFTDLSTGATSWEWNFGDGSSSTQQNPIHHYSVDGIFDVTLTINGSTFETKTDYIKVIPTPDSNFWHTDTLDLNSLTYIFHSPLQKYENTIDYNRLWLLGDGSGYTIREFTHTFPDTGLFQVALEVYVDSLPRCSSTSTKTISVRNEIYIPNVFSPNGDDKNDQYVIKYNGVTNLSIYIYSRFGNLVYKSTAPTVVWDGFGINGQEMNEGVYYYVLTSEDGVISKAGFFHLYKEYRTYN